jgi:hypothetical protein
MYEDLIGPETITPKFLPAGASLMYGFRFRLSAVPKPTPGTVPALMKVYYGGERTSRSAFQIRLEEH